MIRSDKSPYTKFRKKDASFDSGKGAEFETETATGDLRNFALANGEPRQISGKQGVAEILSINTSGNVSY
jgi:xylose isomerase